MENIYVGITDTSWMQFIKKHYNDNSLNEYINFWTPGKRVFKALKQGELFLFKLHNNKQRNECGEIVGGAYFYGYEKITSEEAWKRFGNGNGTSSLNELQESINGYREKNEMSIENEISCIILYNPFFFDSWIASPTDWSNSIVSGKKYDAASTTGRLLKYACMLSTKTNDNTLINNIEKDVSKLELLGKEKEAYIKMRVNQSVFRDRLLKRYNHCCLCNVENQSLLKASHIKPWSESLSAEKLDVNNGFLLCPNHDALFDNGYISFTDTGEILISSKLSQNDCLFTNITPNMKIKLTEENKIFLKYHRDHIFKS